MVELSQKGMVKGLRNVFSSIQDPRKKGKNTRYSVVDICLGGYGTFFLQSPSFLSYQRAMQERMRRNNANSLFGVHEIPTDDQIRNFLDQLSFADLHLVYGYFFTLLESFEASGHLTQFRIPELDNTLLV